MGQGAEPKHKLEESNFEEGEKKKKSVSSGRKDITVVNQK